MSMKNCPVCGSALISTTISLAHSNWPKGKSLDLWECEGHGWLWRDQWISSNPAALWDPTYLLDFITSKQNWYWEEIRGSFFLCFRSEHGPELTAQVWSCSDRWRVRLGKHDLSGSVETVEEAKQIAETALRELLGTGWQRRWLFGEGDYNG